MVDTPEDYSPHNNVKSNQELLTSENCFCQFCFAVGTRSFIEGEHKAQCLEYPVPCPGRCGMENIPRKDMDEHKKICLSAVRHCEFYPMGCEYRADYGSMEKHYKESTTQHLSLTRDVLDKTKLEFVTTVQNLEKQHADFVHETNLVIADLKDKVQQAMDKSAEAQGQISMLERELELLKQKAEGSQSKKLNWPPVSWDDDINVQPVNVRGLKDESVPVLPVYIKMSQFDKHRRSRAAWYSDPFYSHEKGYKMRLQIKASGLGAGVRDVYVSVLIHLMQGKYDDELPWPITNTFVIRLLNQISDKNHWEREACFATAWYEPIKERVTGDHETGIYGRGCFDFIAIKRISKIKPSCQYVKDDSIIFVIDRSPWDSW